ncbi:MAG: hypothetical protein AB1Z19_08120 [Eubacteriales bacterium]
MMIKNKTFRNVIKWIARVVGILVGLFFLIFAIGEGFSYGAAYPTAYEWVLILFIPVGMIVGVVIAWWKEGLGAIIITASVLMFNISQGALFPDQTYYSFDFWGLFILAALNILAIRPKEKA